MNICAILAIVLATASASVSSFLSLRTVAVLSQHEIKGVVANFTKCGGPGTPNQLRIAECDGRCEFVSGGPLTIEYDMTPGTVATSLTISADLRFDGMIVTLLDVEIPGSNVDPGLTYTIQFSVTPNGAPVGSALFRIMLYHTENRLLEICGQTEVDIAM